MCRVFHSQNPEPSRAAVHHAARISQIKAWRTTWMRPNYKEDYIHNIRLFFLSDIPQVIDLQVIWIVKKILICVHMKCKIEAEHHDFQHRNLLQGAPILQWGFILVFWGLCTYLHINML